MDPSLVPRPDYDALLETYRQAPEIKVLTGVRRCGKSSLLALFSERLVAVGAPPENICHLRLDGYDVPLGVDAAWLMGQVSERLAASQANQTSYVLLERGPGGSGLGGCGA